jgi:4'-phosphopantetheinyl transferase
MSLPATLDGPWRFGPVTVWRRPHVPGQRGEPQARQVLAQALGADPQTLPLVRDDKGRPELSGPLAHYGTGWSHSGEVLLVALGEGVRLGVDLELLRPRPRLLEIVRRFFHPEEVAWLERLDEAGREHWFFRVWCVKEAMLKAHGQGISFGLHRLQLAPGRWRPAPALVRPGTGRGRALAPARMAGHRPVPCGIGLVSTLKRGIGAQNRR